MTKQDEREWISEAISNLVEQFEQIYPPEAGDHPDSSKDYAAYVIFKLLGTLSCKSMGEEKFMEVVADILSAAAELKLEDAE